MEEHDASERINPPTPLPQGGRGKLNVKIPQSNRLYEWKMSNEWIDNNFVFGEKVIYISKCDILRVQI